MKAMFIRQSVFIEELSLPAGWEKDGQDEDAVLLIAMDSLTGLPVGTARVVDGEDGVAIIGMLAVSLALRGHGIGGALLQAAVKTSQELNFTSATMDVPVLAVPFCRKRGFEEQGEEFSIGTVLHRRMVRSLLSSDAA